MKGPDRFMIGPSAGHVELMMALLDETAEPFGVLYDEDEAAVLSYWQWHHHPLESQDDL